LKALLIIVSDDIF